MGRRQLLFLPPVQFQALRGLWEYANCVFGRKNSKRCLGLPAPHQTEFDKLKQTILRKQEAIVELSDQITEQQKTIEKLTREIEETETEHKKTVTKLYEQLNPDRTDVLTQEIKDLREEIQKKIQLIEEHSDQQIKKAVEEARNYQQKAYRSVREKIEEREGLQRQQFRKSYIEQLQKEKADLEKELLKQQQLNEEKLDEIKRVEEDVQKLRVLLRTSLQDSLKTKQPEDSQHSAPHEEPHISRKPTQLLSQELLKLSDIDEALHQAGNDQPETDSQQTDTSHLHKKCKAEIEAYQTQIKTLAGTIAAMKKELKPVITGTIEALRDCQLLDSFLKNNQVTLTTEQKRDLAERMSQDKILVQAIVKMGQSRTVNGARRANYLMKTQTQ